MQTSCPPAPACDRTGGILGHWVILRSMCTAPWQCSLWTGCCQPPVRMLCQQTQEWLFLLMKNNFRILISNNPQSWGLDVENGGRGKEESRTKEADEGWQSIIHSFNKYLLNVYPMQILGCLSCPDFHLIWVDTGVQLSRARDLALLCVFRFCLLSAFT